MVVHPHPWRTSKRLPAEHPPDVFILDLDTERDAVGTITQLRESAPTSKIVLLCGLEDKDRTCEAFAAGVDGVILKIQPPEVVLAVIEALYASAKLQTPVERAGPGGGNLGIPAKHTGESALPPPAWPDALTEREREIIRLVEQGLSNKDIAYTLSISDSTVRHHMTSIFDKVGVPNRQKLLIHAHHFRSTPV
jgi:DNA-binding NarL/FixJ family response regulator